MWKWAVFGQVSRSFFSERLALSLGLRADGCNYTGKTAALYRQISPRFSFSYAFDERWSLNGNIGRYYQLPAYTTLGFADAGEFW